MKHKTKLCVSYRILDTENHCLEIIKQEGYNRNYIQWMVERKVRLKYGKIMKIHKIKIEKIDENI